jgi:hypothetical protein
MATAVQVESLWNGLTDNSGQPLGAGKVYTYSAGTTTPVSLYTASDKSSSATNPLILDANGKAQVWADGRYKFEVKTSADVTLYTLDNLLYGFDDTTVLLGGVSTGSANAQTVSVPATVQSYSNGQRVTFIAGFTNTGATTLRFNALSAISIVKGPTPSALQAGDLLAGQLYSCTYYGGSFYLENAPTPADVQRSRSQLVTSISGTNTLTGVTTPALTGYETGQVFRFKATGANTGATTININSQGAKAIQRYGVALVGGEIQNNDMVEVVYDGTQFQLVGATPAPLFVDRTNSRVGIGVTNPGFPLEVAAESGAAISIQARGRSSDNQGVIRFTQSDGTTELGRMAGYPVGLDIQKTGANPIIFWTNGAERMRIGGTGLVGIGTNSPGYPLEVAAESGAAIGIQVRGRSADNTGVIRFAQNNGSTETSRIEVTATKLNIVRAGANSIDFNVNSSSRFEIGSTDILCKATGIKFDGSTVVGNNNSIGLRWTSPDLYGTVDNSVSMVIGTTSDYRLKANFTPRTEALELIKQLIPGVYNPIELDGDVKDSEHWGMIAHEVAEVIPSVVSGEKDKEDENGNPQYQSINYAGVVPLLIIAIKELSSKIEALEAALEP